MRFDDDIARDLCTSTQISDDLPTLEELAVLQVMLCSLQSYMTNVISNILGGTEYTYSQNSPLAYDLQNGRHLFMQRTS